MPPKGARVSPAEVAILRTWVEQGAVWTEGFAFKQPAFEPPLRPRRPVLPEAKSGRTHPLDRVLDVFPTDQRDQIRIMVSESLRGVISQQLVPRADGTGRSLAIEILMNTPAVGNVIRESKTFMLPGIIQTGRKLGMKLMDDSLLELFEAGIISAEEAVYRAEQKNQMMRSTGYG